MDVCINKLDNPNDDVGYLIWRITKYWQRGKSKLLDEYGLTGPQLELMGAICHMSRLKIEATQILLSQETEIDPMTTSTVLRNLQKKGLINRRESTTDTRARIVELTEEGFELFIKAVSKVKESQDELFRNIDVNVLKTQLQSLLKEMDRLNKTSDNK